METEAKIINVDISEEVKKSYLSYAMSVIVGRALPDVRDGLKPVHRRILYAMYLMSLWHNKPYKKSARVVGEVLGKFHPHGDQAIYDALVRMAQDFSMNLPLIDGHGNFGSIDGDSPAAMRYTEVRLSKASELLLEDIDKETVDFVLNFDGTLEEPLVLPAKFPNLLVNGTVGIAVGMATNIPPHNLGEVVDAIKYLIDNRKNLNEITTKDLMQFIKGPDFPTGGIIYDSGKLERIYEKGRGVIEIWSKVDIEKNKIIIKEIPYMVNKSKMIEEIAKLVKEGKIEGIKDIRDESNRYGIRVVIELRSNVNPEKILNLLYAYTSLKSNFPIICVALKGLEPKQMSLKEMLWEYVKHRYDVLLRKSKYELRKAEERKHILDGLMIAIANIDETVRLIKTSKNRDEAKTRLISRFNIDDIQANAILDMPLVRLTNLETEKIKNEIEDLIKRISYLRDFISDENKIYQKIKDDLESIKKEFNWERKTEVRITKIDLVDEIKDEREYLIVYTIKGYIKKIPSNEFREQKRGGKGISISLIESDEILGALEVKGYDKLIILTNKGKAYTLNVSDIEIARRYSKGRTIYSYLEHIEDDEKIVKILPYRKGTNIIFLSKKGMVKKTSSEHYANIRKTGIIALNIKNDDELQDATIEEKKYSILIATSKGKGLRFKSQELRKMGRVAAGVKGISLRDDYAVKVLCLDDNDEILIITTLGYGKRLRAKDISIHGRGTSGAKIINIKQKENIAYVRKIENEHLFILTSKGMIIKIDPSKIPIQGRNSRGVRLINLKKGDIVRCVV